MDRIQVWEDGKVPFLKGTKVAGQERITNGSNCVCRVIEPDITIFPSENPIGAVMVMPGGGYELLAVDSEGYQVGERLSSRGITVGVLTYRLPLLEISDEPWKLPICDAQHALLQFRRWIDDHTEGGGVPVGVMGFSAGAHLAAWLTLSLANQGSIDFTSLIYGVNSIEDYVVDWLSDKLYHRTMTQEEKASFDFQAAVGVCGKLSPFFLVHAKDDDIVPCSESTDLARCLTDAGIENKLLLFENGGHGFGLGRESDGTATWTREFVEWFDTVRASRGNG